jgi:hypothetical protein
MSQPRSRLAKAKEQQGRRPGSEEGQDVCKQAKDHCVALIFPALRMGEQGGGAGGTVAWYAVPELLGLAELPAWPSVFVMPYPPLRKGKKGLARIFIRSRAPKTRLSKPCREHVQPCRFITHADHPPERGEMDAQFLPRVRRGVRQHSLAWTLGFNYNTLERVPIWSRGR